MLSCRTSHNTSSMWPLSQHCMVCTVSNMGQYSCHMPEICFILLGLVVSYITDMFFVPVLKFLSSLSTINVLCSFHNPSCIELDLACPWAQETMLMACVGNLADIFSVLFPLITEQQKWVPSYAFCLWSWAWLWSTFIWTKMICLQFVCKAYAFIDGTKRFLQNIPCQNCHISCENI